MRGSKDAKPVVGEQSWNKFSYILLFFMTSWPITVAKAKNATSNTFDFAITTSTLSIEVVKMVVSAAASPLSLSDLISFTLAHPLYAVPGFIYAVNNNMIYLILELMPTPHFMLLEKVKIITTAILFYVFLGRQLSRVQWLSIVLLFLGTSLQHVGSVTDIATMQWRGIVYVAILASLSGIAATFSEYALKRDMASSIHAQNFALYAYSTLVCVASALYQDTTIFSHFFTGWSFATLLVVANGTLMGLFVSQIMKTQSSLAKVYINTLAMVLSTLISIAMGDYQLTLLFVYSGAIVICAILLYYEKTGVPPSQRPPTAASVTLPRYR